MSRAAEVLVGLLLFSLLVAVVAIPRVVASESVAEMWIRQFGGARDEIAFSAVETPDGGYAIAGYTGSYGNGAYDFWLIKTDGNGNLVWNRTYGGVGEDIAECLIQTSDGGYAMAGWSDLSGTGGNYDFYLVKTDTDGNEQWNKTYGRSGHEYAESVIQTVDGGYALVGTGFWLIKTDENGNAQWNRTCSTGDARTLVQTDDGGYAIGGGAGDFQLVKTDELGTMEWNGTYGGSSQDELEAMVQSADGGYVLAGGTSSLGAGNFDFWLVKTDVNGNEQWNETYGGASFDFASCIVRTDDDGYAMVGYTYSFANASNGCFWLVKTDGEGHEQWNQTYVVTGSDHGKSLIQTSDGGYLLVGLSGAYSWMDFLIIKTDSIGIVSEFQMIATLLAIIVTVTLSLALVNTKIRRKAYSNAQ